MGEHLQRVLNTELGRIGRGVFGLLLAIGIEVLFLEFVYDNLLKLLLIIQNVAFAHFSL